MSTEFKVACIQMTSLDSIAPTMSHVEQAAREAREQGADLITTPECTSMMVPGRRNVLAKAREESEDEGLARFRAVAKETGAWILAGSLIIKIEPERCANRSYLIDDQGEIVARYDKIHMFDVNLEDGESYQESRTYRPGDRAVLAPTPWGVLGMTVCYDMRFAHLYRQLAQAGADFVSVPSAFTRPTGRAHWHTLLRSRAIETGCFVFAPAQCGEHPGGRKTYGHSLVIDPWGGVIAEGGESPQLLLADIDPSRVAHARAQIPAWGSNFDFAPPALDGPQRAPGQSQAAD